MKEKEGCCDCLKKTGHILTTFCENTSIPGLHMVVYEGKHWTEKILWALIVLGGFIFSVYFCRQLYVKWEDNPTLTTVESNFHLIKNEPFPAVTICNANKVSMSKLVQEMAKHDKFAGISISKMQQTLSFLTNLDQTIGNTEKMKELDRFYKAINVSTKDLFHLLRDTAPVCRDMILDCVFQGHDGKPCMEYFSFLPTNDGFCCVFNSGTNFSDPDLNIRTTVPTKKLYLKGTGPRNGGLSVIINANVLDYSVPHERFDGFKVLVHSSDEFSDVSDRGFVISPGHETFVALKGISTFVTREVVGEVSPQKRQCEVPEQRALTYFTNYSRPKCIIDCIIQEMLKKCACRPYFLNAQVGTPLCDLAKHSCINMVYEDVLIKEPCNCLPLCNAEWFEPEISYATFPGRAFFSSNHSTSVLKRIATKLNLDSDTDLDQYLKMNVARLHIFLKDKTSLRYKTDVRYDVEDFVSNIGGLLGLGVGICFISVVEIFYFLCIRGFLKIAVKRYKSRNGHRPIPSN